MLQIAIDGPASAGKSSIAKALAKKLEIAYLDTGAMYRAAGLYAKRLGIDPYDEKACGDIMQDITLDICFDASANQHIMLNGEDVTAQIRENEISLAATAISNHKKVREELVRIQQKIANGKPVVMDGRDIGTVVLPEARCKFYITANSHVRAKRRHDELLQKGLTAPPLEQLESEIISRDNENMTRANSPLVVASGAIVIDTTDLTLEEVVQKVLNHINSPE